ncbi:MAG: YbhB/YbcL family Raf kinase inhibitor-like protein [Deltaproteobacteria bacterium]|nr:YbhB/YbcL family Raf kinase inhibitor-like protein [Deltaproteobacteria bacterium]
MRLISYTGVTVQVVGLSLLLILRANATADPNPILALTSSAFENQGTIPEQYTCSGRNESPELRWTGIPGGTRSLSLILDDPDAPIGTFVHWVIYNLSPTTTGLPEGVSATASIADSEQGTNGSGTIGYTGPCPPPGKPHHYHFRLYALDQKLKLKAGATAHQVEAAIKGHVLGRAELVGIFAR